MHLFINAFWLLLKFMLTAFEPMVVNELSRAKHMNDQAHLNFY